MERRSGTRFAIIQGLYTPWTTVVVVLFQASDLGSS